MKCPSCENANRPEAKFCSNCGTKLQRACPQCEAEIELTDRFCSQCGAALTAQTTTQPTKSASTEDPLSYTPRYLVEKILRNRTVLEGERRIVTVLFCDLKSSTTLAEHLGPEGMHVLLNRFFELALNEVHRYEGTINQFLGDGFMALFGAPVACEDHARRAVLAALALQKAIQDEQFVPGAGETVEVVTRMGLNTGQVVVGTIGDNLRMDYTAMGDTTNLAARMEQSAEPGTVYLSASTYRAVSDYIECEPLGTIQMKGKSAPVGVYKALHEKLIRTRLEAATQRGLTPFVGRHREFAVIRECLKKVKHSQGQVVFLSGEAGIGKSRFLLEFRRSLQGENVTWLEGHCISFGRNISYFPFIDLIKRTFGVDDSDDDDRIIQRLDDGTADWEETTRATVPYLKFLLNVDAGNPAVTVMDPVERRAGIFDALCALLIEESRESPLVVVVEDLHWIDDKSDKALAVLVEVVVSVPVLLILSHRPGYMHTLGKRTHDNRLVLGNLPPDESTAIAQSVLGIAALPEELHGLITRKAEGNPFYTEEVTKSLMESGALRKTNGAYTLERPIEQIHVPDTIQGVILSRIDRLQHQAKAAVQLASVIGREFTFRLLDRISEVEAGLENLLGELKLLELIYEKVAFPELSYMFKHALTQDVAYSTLLQERR
jgi:class 3 adenylate cyclase